MYYCGKLSTMLPSALNFLSLVIYALEQIFINVRLGELFTFILLVVILAVLEFKHIVVDVNT